MHTRCYSQSHMARRLRVGLATEKRNTLFTARHRRSHSDGAEHMTFQPLLSQTAANLVAVLSYYRLSVFLLVFIAMLQADDEGDMMEMQMKSPFGSSFRTFNATDYKPIGKTFFFF